ncbi:hypothetical protein Tco_1062423 [Tanacetum coccineum]
MRLASYIVLLGLVLENVFTALWNLTEEETTTTELPSNIVLTEILPRLPTKLLSRCMRPPREETFIALSLPDRDHFCNTFVLLLCRNGPVGEGKCKTKVFHREAPAFRKCGGYRAI